MGNLKLRSGNGFARDQLDHLIDSSIDSQSQRRDNGGRGSLKEETTFSEKAIDHLNSFLTGMKETLSLPPLAIATIEDID